MFFRQLFDVESSTYTYLIADPNLKDAILVDPVLEQVERDSRLLKELGLTLRYCLETHIHADHITGTGQLQKLTGCQSIVPEQALASCADWQIQDLEILELGEIISGTELFSRPTGAVTICDLTGTGAQDTAIAVEAFGRVKAANLGTSL